MLRSNDTRERQNGLGEVIWAFGGMHVCVCMYMQCM